MSDPATVTLRRPKFRWTRRIVRDIAVSISASLIATAGITILFGKSDMGGASAARSDIPAWVGTLKTAQPVETFGQDYVRPTSASYAAPASELKKPVSLPVIKMPAADPAPAIVKIQSIHRQTAMVTPPKRPALSETLAAGTFAEPPREETKPSLLAKAGDLLPGKDKLLKPITFISDAVTGLARRF